MKLQLLLERNFLIEIDEIRQYVFINGKLLNIYHNVFMFSIDLCPSPQRPAFVPNGKVQLLF